MIRRFVEADKLKKNKKTDQFEYNLISEYVYDVVNDTGDTIKYSYNTTNGLLTLLNLKKRENITIEFEEKFISEKED